jgi:putative transposase
MISWMRKGEYMSKSQHTEAQMIGALKQLEAGRTAEDIGRELGVSKHTIYAWKAKYGGMSVSEAQEEKQLREENTRLKKLVVDLSLDKEMLKAVIAKKRMELVDQRSDASWLRMEYAASSRRVCGLLTMAASSYRYVAVVGDDEDLVAQLVELSREQSRRAGPPSPAGILVSPQLRLPHPCAFWKGGDFSCGYHGRLPG